MELEGTRQRQAHESVEDAIHRGDPLVRLLVGRLGLRAPTVALIAAGWAVIYILVLSALFGSLWSRGEYLGSLDDWHAQLLLLLVFPVLCAFYVWQPEAIARVYQAIGSPASSCEAGQAYRKRPWLALSLVAAAAIVCFDAPKMIAHYGSWWMVENWLTILGREASLAVAFYMLSMIAWRQTVSTVQWRRSFASPGPVRGLKAASLYQLSLTLLFALLALRLSVEGIELPRRVGSITPDYYLKIAAYILLSLLCFFTPLWGAFRSGGMSRARRLSLCLVWAAIAALPLPAFLLLRLVVGP